MKIITTDNNEFLEDGVTPNPNIGAQTTVDVPDPPPSTAERQAAGRATHEANIRARAAGLRKRGQYAEALSLLSTIGG